MNNVKAGDKTMYQYQLQYNRFLAEMAHKYGMAVGLKVCTPCSRFLSAQCVESALHTAWGHSGPHGLLY